VIGEANLLVLIASTLAYHPADFESALLSIHDHLKLTDDAYFSRWKGRFTSASDFARRFKHLVGFFFTNTAQSKFVPNMIASETVFDAELIRALSKLETQQEVRSTEF
jgi:hypothetical protein